MPDRVLTMISSMRGGGSEQQTLSLLRHLDRSRFSPHLFVLERTGELMSRVPEDVVIHSFSEVDKGGGIYFPGRVLRHQIRHLREILQRESIDVIYDRTFHMSLIAGPAGNTCGVPRVSTIVSPPHFALPLVESRFVAVKKARLARAYRHSRDVIAVSRQTADSAVEYYGLPDDAIRVIHNSVDTEAIRRSARTRIEKRPGCITLVCVGRMTREKGQRYLLDALSLAKAKWPNDLPEIELWMIGDGPLRQGLELQSKAITGGFTTTFLGSMQNPLPYMASADALVLPSLFEGMPNVVLEAMALGTPVIATHSGGTVELERNDPTIQWARPGDAASMAEAILAFAKDPDSAAQRAKAAIDMIDEHHNVVHATRLIEDLLSRRV